MKKEILRMEHLTIQGIHRSAEDIDLLVRSGECVLLTGLNNSGAQEVCELFDGKGTADKGRLFLYGKQITEIQRRVMKRQRVFYLAGRPPLFKDITLAEYLFLLRKHPIWKLKANKKIMRQRADALFQHYKLDFQAEQKNTSLNRVEQQLFWLVWAADQKAGFIVLQEPETGLTAPEIHQLTDLIYQMKEEGISFLIVTGHSSSFFSVADHVVFMQGGKIQKKLLEPSDFYLCTDLMNSQLGNSLYQTVENKRGKVGDICLQYKNLREGASHKFDLNLRYGEVMTLTSPDSMWQEILWEDLTFKKKSEVSLLLDGTPISCNSVTDLMKYRIVTWASGEASDCLFDNLNYGENLLLPSLKRISRGGFYQKNASYVLQDENFFGTSLPEDAPIPKSRYAQLELMTKRWEFFHPRAIFMWNIFSNADAEETELLKRFVQNISKRGTAVLLLEVELRECLDISHEIILLR